MEALLLTLIEEARHALHKKLEESNHEITEDVKKASNKLDTLLNDYCQLMKKHCSKVANQR